MFPLYTVATMRVYANVTKAQAQNEMMRMEGKMKLK